MGSIDLQCASLDNQPRRSRYHTCDRRSQSRKNTHRMDQPTPEEQALQLIISAMLKTHNISTDRLYQLLAEMEEFQIEQVQYTDDF